MSFAAQVQFATDLATVTCGKCGGIYAISERYRLHKQEHGGYWNCPYCQCGWGFGESDISKVSGRLRAAEQQVELERKRTEWARQDARITERRRRALKGQLTKVKKRVSHGACPCCNRSFENLRRHVQVKHPSYIATKGKSHHD